MFILWKISYSRRIKIGDDGNMKLSEGKVKKVYEITGLNQITDEGRKVFQEKGIIVGGMIYYRINIL